MLLALDEWRFDGVRDTKTIFRGGFSAKSLGYTLISCGSLPSQPTISTFISKLHLLIKESAPAAKESDGKRKDEKTPAFIEALVTEVVDWIEIGEEEEAFLSRGGTGDVGRHTGSGPRLTSWALVSAFIKARVSTVDSLFLFDKFILYVDLFFLEDYISSLNPFTLTKSQVNTAFAILEEAVDKAVVFDLVLDSINEQLSNQRRRLNELLQSLCSSLENNFTLPSGMIDFNNLSSLKTLTFVRASEPDIVSISINSFDKMRKQALKDIGYILSIECPCIDAPGQIHAFWMFVDSYALNSLRSFVLVFNGIEAFMFYMAPLLDNSKSSILSLEDIRALKSLSVYYQSTLMKYKDVYKPSRSWVQHRSHEVLVIWVACCLIHQYCVSVNPLLASYGIALSADDLRIIVTNSAVATKTCQILSRYIRSWTKGPNQAVFSLRDGNSRGTIRFAEMFSRESSSIQARLVEEKNEVLSRQNRFMHEINAKKDAAASFRVLYLSPKTY